MRRGIPLIQHEINDHSRNRNVQPNRHRESPKSTVPIESRAESRDHCDGDQWQDRKGKHQMRNQDDVIDRSDPAAGCKFHGPFSDRAHQAKVIRQITGQEHSRTNKGSDHASYVNTLAVATNSCPPSCNKASTQTVQGRVNRRKIKDIHLRYGGQRCNRQ